MFAHLHAHCSNPYATCGDKDAGTHGGLAPSPITDAECGKGWFFDPAHADRICSSIPCDITAGTTDFALCCTEFAKATCNDLDSSNVGSVVTPLLSPTATVFIYWCTLRF
jgi:hypothetical protein